MSTIMSSNQAAKALDVSVRAIQIHCRKLNVERMGRDYIITPKVMKKLKGTVQHGPGRPKK